MQTVHQISEHRLPFTRLLQNLRENDCLSRDEVHRISKMLFINPQMHVVHRFVWPGSNNQPENLAPGIGRTGFRYTQGFNSVVI